MLTVLLTLAGPEHFTEPFRARLPAVSPREALLRKVMDKHYDFVWRTLRRLGLSPADAEDAAQNVFLIADRRGLESVDESRRFLYAIAIRVASNSRRSITRRREVPQTDVDYDGTASSSPERDLEMRESVALLDRVLARLEPDLLRVFSLAMIEQLSRAEIAKLEGIPRGTVASRLQRARADLAKELAIVNESDASCTDLESDPQ